MEPKSKEEVRAFQKYRSGTLLTDDEITTMQTMRKASLLSEETSPISAEERTKIEALDFFPIDKKYQLELKLREYENPEPVRIPLTNGENVDALRAGYFVFEIEGRTVTLFAYKTLPRDTAMFLPFRDKTSGRETYGGGRSLNLYRNPEGIYVLDFNLACAPLCAFDKRYDDCPLPPRENWIMSVEIRAGEMNLKT